MLSTATAMLLCCYTAILLYSFTALLLYSFTPLLLYSFTASALLLYCFCFTATTSMLLYCYSPPIIFIGDNRMYLQCLLISRNTTGADEQTSKIKSQIGAKQLADVYKSQQYRSTIRANHMYIDSGLTFNSRNSNQRMKEAIEKHAVQFVLVSPLKADLETCLDLFAENSQVSVIVDPLLVPRVNSLANISEGNPEELQKFKTKPSLVKLEANPKWYLAYGRQGGSASSFMEAVGQVEKDQDYESEEHYHQRLSEFRKDLINHIGPKKSKVAVIAHPQVLQGLTSTGHYEDYSLINSIPFSFGEAKSEFVWIEGIEGELESSGIPFCS